MKKATKKIRFGIRQKLFVLVLVGFSALIVATSWRIGEEANKVAFDSIERSLSQSSVILQTKLESRFLSINETAVGLAKDARILPLVYEGEALTLQDLSQEFQKVLEFDVLFFTDNEGTILARSDRPEAMGQSVAGRSSLFDQALGGEESQGIISSKGRLLQIVVVPIFDNFARDIVRGTVALAYELSPEIAREINALTESDIGFFMFERNSEREIDSVSSIYNTNENLADDLNVWFSHHAGVWREIYNNKGSVNNLEINIAGEDFFAVVHPLAKHDGENLGFVIATRSRTELLKPFLRIRQQVIVVGLICLVIASLIAWVIAHKISRPIISLVAVAKDIAEGNYPESQDAVKQKDEVGVLYNAIYRMGNNLKEKAELESYLAQLGEDLDRSSEALVVPDPTENIPVIDSQDDADRTVARSPDASPAPSTHVATVGGAIGTGTIISKRYEVIRLLGSGAMGDVFLAKDLDLDENIAIKVLEKQDFTKEELHQFKEEIRLARRITHRNILRTFDFGVWNKAYFITMEYVHGHDLDQFIKKQGALDLNIGIAMAKQICTAMNAAHEQGIIHRDLKPANMMINRQGILKIMDFGLAMKLLTPEEHKKKLEQGGDAESTTVAGTPRYMAPEQFFGWDLDKRTDIYSIGIILFTLFAGRPPFSAKTFEELGELHYKARPPKLTKLVKAFPKRLEQIIHKALQKSPEKRFQSVRHLLDQLQNL